MVYKKLDPKDSDSDDSDEISDDFLEKVKKEIKDIERRQTKQQYWGFGWYYFEYSDGTKRLVQTDVPEKAIFNKATDWDKNGFPIHPELKGKALT